MSSSSELSDEEDLPGAAAPGPAQQPCLRLRAFALPVLLGVLAATPCDRGVPTQPHPYLDCAPHSTPSTCPVCTQHHPPGAVRHGSPDPAASAALCTIYLASIISFASSPCTPHHHPPGINHLVCPTHCTLHHHPPGINHLVCLIPLHSAPSTCAPLRWQPRATRCTWTSTSACTARAPSARRAASQPRGHRRAGCSWPTPSRWPSRWRCAWWTPPTRAGASSEGAASRGRGQAAPCLAHQAGGRAPRGRGPAFECAAFRGRGPAALCLAGSGGTVSGSPGWWGATHAGGGPALRVLPSASTQAGANPEGTRRRCT